MSERLTIRHHDPKGPRRLAWLLTVAMFALMLGPCAHAGWALSMTMHCRLPDRDDCGEQTLASCLALWSEAPVESVALAPQLVGAAVLGLLSAKQSVLPYPAEAVEAYLPPGRGLPIFLVLSQYLR